MMLMLSLNPFLRAHYLQVFYVLFNLTEGCRVSYNSAPVSKNAVSAFQISCKTTFFYLGRFVKKLADDHCSSILKTVYTISNIMSIQPFKMGMDWTEIARLMEVSFIFNICRFCVFTWYGRALKLTLILNAYGWKLCGAMVISFYILFEISFISPLAPTLHLSQRCLFRSTVSSATVYKHIYIGYWYQRLSQI